MAARNVVSSAVGRRLYYDPASRSLAQTWAGCCELVEAAAPPDDEARFHLWAVNDHVELRCGSVRGPGAWVSAAELERRSAQGGDLARACGVSAAHRPSVLDVMAGWGVDGLVLARRGCPVTLVEREPLLCVLLEDLLRRSALSHVTCRCADAAAVLGEAAAVPGEGACWDVIYLDPMFPARSKSALPGKRMQWLAMLAHADARPLSRWLELATPRARERVVVKRRRRDPAAGTPAWQIVGRTVRFDVYRGGAP